MVSISNGNSLFAKALTLICVVVGNFNPIALTKYQIVTFTRDNL
jgi:hypothetical protein